MSVKNKKQFGVWMDAHQATIIGKKQPEGAFEVLAHEQITEMGGNSNENTSNNGARTQQLKFFKQITKHMQNAEELHVTGTGQVQEQFIHFMEESPQFKNAVSKHSTTQKMSDDKLVAFISEKFNG